METAESPGFSPAHGTKNNEFSFSSQTILGGNSGHDYMETQGTQGMLHVWRLFMLWLPKYPTLKRGKGRGGGGGGAESNSEREFETFRSLSGIA